MARKNIWIYKENEEMYESIPNKSAWINELLALLRDEMVKELMKGNENDGSKD